MMYNVGLQYAVLKIYKEFPFFFFGNFGTSQNVI